MLYLGSESYCVSYKETFNPTVYVGKYSSLGSNVEFYGKAHHQQVKYRDCVTSYPFRLHSAWRVESFFESGVSRREDHTIYVGSDVWIGDNALIMDGVKIGDGAVIGARAVVTKDVGPYEIVAGNPARVKRVRFNQKQIEQLLKIRWWDWPREVVRSRLEDLKDINVFLKKYSI